MISDECLFDIVKYTNPKYTNPQDLRPVGLLSWKHSFPGNSPFPGYALNGFWQPKVNEGWFETSLQPHETSV